MDTIEGEGEMNEIMQYKGESVRILEVIGGYAYIWIPSRQEAVWVPVENLEEKEGR